MFNYCTFYYTLSVCIDEDWSTCLALIDITASTYSTFTFTSLIPIHIFDPYPLADDTTKRGHLIPSETQALVIDCIAKARAVAPQHLTSLVERTCKTMGKALEKMAMVC